MDCQMSLGVSIDREEPMVWSDPEIVDHLTSSIPKPLYTTARDNRLLLFLGDPLRHATVLNETFAVFSQPDVKRVFVLTMREHSGDDSHIQEVAAVGGVWRKRWEGEERDCLRIW
ncbi:hypothetical protein HDV00_007425 [Rhizophlyctis rosea]|nr:hypothetical protein HDV00_007425 [Rhizophlyctis rosea]